MWLVWKGCNVQQPAGRYCQYSTVLYCTYSLARKRTRGKATIIYCRYSTEQYSTMQLYTRTICPTTSTVQARFCPRDRLSIAYFCQVPVSTDSSYLPTEVITPNWPESRYSFLFSEGRSASASASASAGSLGVTVYRVQSRTNRVPAATSATSRSREGWVDERTTAKIGSVPYHGE